MGKVLFQTDDALNEANLSEWVNHDNLVGYAKDVVINANFVDNVVQVDPTLVWIRDSGGIYTIKPDEATLDLPDSNGENFLYGTFDPSVQDSAAWEVAASEEDVPSPSVIVGVIDTEVESVTKRNTAPDVDVGSVTAESATVESEPTADTDVVRKAEADAKADLPIETEDLSDDAVTAAKIAAAAVDSDAIKDGAVGVAELAEALGTDAENAISGTTHFESVGVGQVDGSITSESITSFTDGELFVESGTLTFTPSGGPEITWLQEGASPVSVQLVGESITVPSDEDWMVSVYADGVDAQINDTTTLTGGSLTVPRIVFPGGTKIEGSGFGTLALTGFDVSETDTDPVGEIDPTIPSAETWVGGIFSGNPLLNGSNIIGSTDLNTTEWTVLAAGDELAEDDQDGAFFGGFEI